MPTQREWHRTMLTHMPNAFMPAHPIGMLSRHAHIVCGTPLRLLTRLECYRGMPNCVRNVIMQRAVPPNRRLQLTAFGARDPSYFDSFVARLGGS